jgi:long-subunit fatty acid transport protein
MAGRGRLSLSGVLVASCLVVLPGWALAQTSTLLFPPSIAITNYDRVLVGQEGALEGGALVARVGDTTSGWYNPAGMATMTSTAIGASASGFETDLLSLEGLGQQRAGGMSLYQLPSFFGLVLGKDVIDSEHWRIGLTIAKPTSWSQRIVGGLAGDTRVSYSSDVAFSTLLPMFSASYSPFASLRFGAGIGVAITSLSETQTFSAQVRAPGTPTQPATANAFLRNLDGGGSIWNLTGTLGVQWDATEHLVVGAMIRTPGLKIMQGGNLTYQNVDNRSTPWNQTFFRDQDATFDFRLPLDVNVGVAWRSKAFEAEFDLRYHSAISEYTLLASNQPIQITTTDPATGLPVYKTQPFLGVTNGARTVWNFAFGGRYNLNEFWSFHGGFFSDASPTDAAGANLFRSVDMYGMTAGAKVRGDHLSGSLGLGYSWGSSQPFQLEDPVTGTSSNTKLTITSLSLLYAVAYKF